MSINGVRWGRQCISRRKRMCLMSCTMLIWEDSRDAFCPTSVGSHCQYLSQVDKGRWGIRKGRGGLEERSPLCGADVPIRLSRRGGTRRMGTSAPHRELTHILKRLSTGERGSHAKSRRRNNMLGEGIDPNNSIRGVRVFAVMKSESAYTLHISHFTPSLLLTRLG